MTSSGALPAHYDTVPYQSTHNTGGAIMGADPATSVVNNYLVGTLAYRAAEGIAKYEKSPGPLV